MISYMPKRNTFEQGFIFTRAYRKLGGLFITCIKSQSVFNLNSQREKLKWYTLDVDYC